MTLIGIRWLGMRARLPVRGLVRRACLRGRLLPLSRFAPLTYWRLTVKRRGGTSRAVRIGRIRAGPRVNGRNRVQVSGHRAA